MKVLVMGGSRFNGYHLVRELVNAGHEVAVCNRGVTPVDFPKEVRRLYADRHDHAQLRAVLGTEEFDCIQDTSAYTPEDVRSMVEIFEGRTGHYIFASSTVVYAASKLLPLVEDTHPVELGPVQQDYGRNKILCERYLTDLWRRRRFPFSVARFSMVLGPRNGPEREQRMWVRLLRGRPILVPGHGSTLGMVGHVEDEARAMRLMMLNPKTFGQIYNVTGKDYYTDDGYVDTLAEIAGVEPRKVYVPSEIMDREAPAGAIEGDRPLIQRLAPYIHGWKAPVVFSTKKLQDDLGFEQRYTFRSGEAQTYEWFQREDLINKLNYDFRAEDALLARLGAE